jgi:hypothetical protein
MVCATCTGALPAADPCVRPAQHGSIRAMCLGPGAAGATHVGADRQSARAWPCALVRRVAPSPSVCTPACSAARVVTCTLFGRVEAGQCCGPARTCWDACTRGVGQPPRGPQPPPRVCQCGSDNVKKGKQHWARVGCVTQPKPRDRCAAACIRCPSERLVPTAAWHAISSSRTSLLVRSLPCVLLVG